MSLHSEHETLPQRVRFASGQAPRVIVVGAGPVGILNALGLARAGVEVTLLERRTDVMRTPRAIVYHWTVLEGLARIGILDEVRQAGLVKQDYAFHVRSTGEQIDYSLEVLGDHTPYPFNVHLGQDRLADIGLRALEQHPHAEVRFGCEVETLRQDDDEVTVVVVAGDGEREELSAGWVVAADGAGSPTRKALGLGFEGMTWDERFVATDVHYDFRALGFARSTNVVDPEFGAIVVQVDESGGTGLWRYTFQESRELPEEGIAERTMKRFAEALPDGAGAHVERYSPYRMHQRSADTMRAGRVLLAGDAAHATNPTGGLGLTSGLFDTFVLYDALAAVVRGAADESVLDRYSAQRLRVFWDKTSPAASENKRFVYNSVDPGRLEEELVQLRRQLTDPDLLFQRLCFTEQLMTAPLV